MSNEKPSELENGLQTETFNPLASQPPRKACFNFKLLIIIFPITIILLFILQFLFVVSIKECPPSCLYHYYKLIMPYWFTITLLVVLGGFAMLFYVAWQQWKMELKRMDDEKERCNLAQRKLDNERMQTEATARLQYQAKRDTINDKFLILKMTRSIVELKEKGTMRLHGFGIRESIKGPAKVKSGVDPDFVIELFHEHFTQNPHNHV